MLTAAPLLLALGFLAVESAEDDTTWTPYYKVHTVPIAFQRGRIAEVNGIPTWLQIAAVGNPIYETVYERIARQDPGDVLIIGAGSGNDVAVANARGASRVDAVEIDGHLLDLGRQHPDRPYDDPRVVTHIGDGRAFLEQTDRDWDTILLALPDSLTLLQGQSSVRLESYLFTQEAVESYRDHLRPGGVFAMYNYYREPWLVDRYAGTLEDAFGSAALREPTASATLSVLVASADPAAVTCPADELFRRPADTPDPATDDHPFPYLRTPVASPTSTCCRSPSCWLLSLVGVRACSAGRCGGCARSPTCSSWASPSCLLETKNVVQFALLFGTTWFVNALVFMGVLVSVLLAVAISKRVVIRRVGMAVRLPARQPSPPTGSSRAGRCSPCRTCRGSSSPSCSPSCRSSPPTSSSPTASATPSTRPPPSAPTCSARWSAALLEYTSLLIGYRHLLLLVAVAVRRRPSCCGHPTTSPSAADHGCVQPRIRAILEHLCGAASDR